MRGVGGVWQSIVQSWLAKGIGLGLLCWGFKGVQKEVSTLQIGSVASPPGQCTCQQLRLCHRLFDQDGHQDSSSTSLLTRPCSLWFCLFPKLRLSLWDNWEMKESVTKVIDTLTQEDFHSAFPEVVGTIQVHCSQRRLLRRRLEFHVCIINKSAHTKKVWKLI